MELKEVTISYGMTVNVGNYESIRYEESETFALDSEEELRYWDNGGRSEAIKDLKNRARRTVGILAEQHVAERTAKK